MNEMFESLENRIKEQEGRLKEEPQMFVPEREELIGVVICDKLNVRKRPTMNSEVVCIISKNDKVTVINPKPGHDFYKVILENGTEGFCMKRYIKLV